MARGGELEGVDMYSIPLVALNYTVRHKLSLYLNPGTVMASDWTHVAEEMGYDYLEIKNFQQTSNPMLNVLEDWPKKSHRATVEGLLDILKKIERNDILTDLSQYIEADCQKYIERKMEVAIPPPIQDQIVGSNGTLGIPKRDDPTKRMPELFGAFICYSSLDFGFIGEMIQKLEEKVSNLKLFVFDHDVSVGSRWSSITFELMEESLSYRDKSYLILVDQFR
ncbi:myeloid differentiation primary response protein MyD88-A-like [Discoglossus pictus]